MIKFLQEKKLYVFTSKYKSEIADMFNKSLFDLLRQGKKILLIKYNHSRTYNKLVDFANAEKIESELVDNFKLTQVELYNNLLMNTFDIIKQLGQEADIIFVEKPNVENGYKYFEFLKELNKGVFVLANVEESGLDKHTDYKITIKQPKSTSEFTCVIENISENTKQEIDYKK